MTTARPTGAPTPPGSLDDPPEARDLLTYLPALLKWRDRLRSQLDDIDQRSRDAAHVTADVTLAFALWQTITTRTDEIVTTWDSGRVLDAERERLAQLLWGRLGTGTDVVLAVSFAEACVLADALVDRITDELDADPRTAGPRIANERDAQLLRSRLAAATGSVAPIKELAERCRDKIAHAPRLAIPDPTVLGDVPTVEGDATEVRAALDAFHARLTLVERALYEADRRFREPLERRDELRGLLDAYRSMAMRRGRAEDPQLHETYQRARAVLWSAPLDLDHAAAMLAEYEQAVRAATSGAEEAPS